MEQRALVRGLLKDCFSMRASLRRAFSPGGRKRAYFWRATNMHLYIGAFIDAMELS